MILYIDVVSVCSLQCPSCSMGSSWGGRKDWPKGVMDPQLFTEILNKAQREFPINFVALYNWTEPLLHPALPELIRDIRRRGLRCHLSSNLNQLPNPSELLAANPEWLAISLSGFTPEVYNRGHRGGNIEVVKENMKRLSEARTAVGSTTAISIIYHMYRYNLHEVALMEEFAAPLGITVGANRAYMTGVEKCLAMHNDPDYGDADDRAVDEGLLVPVRTGIKIASQETQLRCPLREDQITIDVAGDVKICCGASLDKENTVANFLNTPFSVIQELKHQHPLCKACMQANVVGYFQRSTASDLELAGL